jgi:hypothetical protein
MVLIHITLLLGNLGIITILLGLFSFCHRVAVVKAVAKEAIGNFLNYVTVHNFIKLCNSTFCVICNHKWKVIYSRQKCWKIIIVCVKESASVDTERAYDNINMHAVWKEFQSNVE